MIAALGLHLVGEALNDQDIGRVYGDTSLSGELVARVELPMHLEAQASVGYRRMAGTPVDADGIAGDGATTLWYVPIAAIVGPRLALGDLELAAGLGPTTIQWAETAGTAPGIGYRGTKLGILGQAEARLDVAVFNRTLHGRDPDRLRVSIVGGVGGRWTLRPAGDACGGEPCGLDFGAVRLTLGLSMVVP